MTSLLGAGALTNSETYRDGDGTVAAVAMLDTRQTMTSAGRRILQTPDGWVAISSDDAEVVLRCLGVPADDLAAHAATMSVEEMLTELTGADVNCTMVHQQQDSGFFSDAEHDAAGLIASYLHVDYGLLRQPGAFWHLVDRRLQLDRAHPLLGQHTTEVLTEVGLAADEIEALLSEGVAVSR